MTQPKWASWIEAFGGTAFGFVIAIPAQYFVNWWWSLPVSHAATLSIVGFFTVVSVIRGYLWRRACVNLGIKRPLSPAIQAVVAERFRQVDIEGFDIAHDDATYQFGELSRAGIAYVLNAVRGSPAGQAPTIWPWSPKWWKPQGVRRDMVRGLALMFADLELFDRNRKGERAPTATRPRDVAATMAPESKPVMFPPPIHHPQTGEG